jgi:hypothetical protein
LVKKIIVKAGLASASALLRGQHQLVELAACSA